MDDGIWDFHVDTGKGAATERPTPQRRLLRHSLLLASEDKHIDLCVKEPNGDHYLVDLNALEPIDTLAEYISMIIDSADYGLNVLWINDSNGIEIPFGLYTHGGQRLLASDTLASSGLSDGDSIYCALIPVREKVQCQVQGDAETAGQGPSSGVQHKARNSVSKFDGRKHKKRR